MRYTYRYRTFLWPAVLILAGVIALLVNTGRLPVERLGLLVALWPLILVVIGLELIVRRTVHGVAGDVAAALIVLLAIAGSAAYVTVSPDPTATHVLEIAGDQTNVDHATLQVNIGAATINIGAVDGSQLYAARVEYNGPTPRVRFDPDTMVLRVDEPNEGFTFFQPRKLVVNLSLSRSVVWDLDLNSGATSSTVNAANLHVASIEMNMGASRADITLGEPSGDTPIQVHGGALTVTVHVPSSAALSVRLSGGALTLNAFGHSQHGIGSLTFESQSAVGQNGRYDIQVNGGACTVTVDSSAPAPTPQS